MEPPSKRSKIDDDNIIVSTINKYIENIQDEEKQLKFVTSDDIYGALPSVKVYIGHIKNVKDISRVILTLNEKIPLKELQHLKRVTRNDVILCPTHHLNDKSSIQEYIECNAEELKDVFEYFKEIEVPGLPPKVTKQFQETKKMWPCNFHPNRYLENIVNGNFFTAFESRTHKRYMALVLEITKWYAAKTEIQYSNSDVFDNVNATVVVDPIIDSVVTMSFDNRINHPIQHSTMLAIDNVAKTQDGGAWFNESNSCDILLPYLKEKFPLMRFGSKKFINKQDLSSNEDGPYLCTGYYVYTLKEPCFMCSMALVHARAKRVFFCLNNLQHGALFSRTKLQEVTSLNHHFEVFTGFL